MAEKAYTGDSAPVLEHLTSKALQSCLIPWKYVAATAEAGEQCPGGAVLDALQHIGQVNLKGVPHRRTAL